MSTMLRLVQNENLKLYKSKRTWIMIILFLALLIGVSSLSAFVTIPKISKDELRQEMEISKDRSGERYELLKYCSKEDQNLWRIQFFISNYRGACFFIVCLIVIVATNIVGKEFSEGTIKLLLTRPVHRASVLFSKYLSLLIFSLLMFIGHFLIFYVSVGILFKTSLFPFVYKEMFGYYGDYAVEALLIGTLAFTVSTIFRSTGLATGLTLFAYFIGDKATRVLAEYYSWAKYSLFVNMDLSQYDIMHSNLPIGFQGMSITFSAIVLAVYYCMFVLIAWYSFVKRDVAV